jgi:hypothetical protein
VEARRGCRPGRCRGGRRRRTADGRSPGGYRRGARTSRYGIFNFFFPSLRTVRIQTPALQMPIHICLYGEKISFIFAKIVDVARHVGPPAWTPLTNCRFNPTLSFTSPPPTFCLCSTCTSSSPRCSLARPRTSTPVATHRRCASLSPSHARAVVMLLSPRASSSGGERSAVLSSPSMPSSYSLSSVMPFSSYQSTGALSWKLTMLPRLVKSMLPECPQGWGWA